jgi:hypothetical protein
MEIIFLVVTVLVGVAANTQPLSYGPKNGAAGPVYYPPIYPKSYGKYDGFVIESSEFSKIGGTVNAFGNTIALGDDVFRRQSRGILHFNVKISPTAVIDRAVLKLKKQGKFGGRNPFVALGLLRIDMCNPSFGVPELLRTDFQVRDGCLLSVAAFETTPINGWYRAVLNRTARLYIARNGSTQFRLSFTRDDNNNSVADYVRFFSGNYSTNGFRPTLEIRYHKP